jgi:ribosomal RNA-processing protein 36
LHRNEARGHPTLHQQRERKRTALEIASERLAKLKEKTKTEYDAEEDGGPSKKRKKSKHAPTEVSSKRSDFFRRGPLRLNESGLGIEIGANRYKPLDPRTNSLNGHLNEEQFEKSYEFLQDMRDKEIVQLKKQIGARKETGKKGKRKRRQMNISGGSIEEDQSRLLQLKQEKADFERRKVERAAKRAVKNKIKTEVEEGKRGAYFLKRKEKKKMEFEAKMEELQKRGGHKAVEKALEKRRKKAKSKDSQMFVKK